MGFLGVLGWVIATFLIGFFLGIAVGGSAMKKQKQESDHKVAEK